MWSESKNRGPLRVKWRRGLFLVCVSFTCSLALISSLDLNDVSASIDDNSKECMSSYEPDDELDFRFQTLLTWPKKEPEFYAPEWKPSKRRGSRRVATTLFNIHEMESVPVFFGRLPPQKILDSLFRCRGFGEKRRVDPILVETVVEAAKKFRSKRVNIISAYRSPKFNDALAKKGRRVAAESKHTKGQAMDFSLQDVPASTVGAWLIENFEGGVGIYRRDNFVHIDMGLKRRWYGK